MTTAEAMQGIEGLEFSARLNIVSDFRTFLRILVEQPEIQFLIQQPKDVMYARLAELLEYPSGHEENQYDVAIAAYLYILENTEIKLKQCWWARKMLERLEEFAKDLESGAKIQDDYVCRKIVL